MLFQRAASRALPSRTVVAQTRSKSTIIPPNVSSFKEIGKLVSTHPQAHPEMFAKMKSFYAAIPKGPKQQVEAKGFWEKYRRKYYEQNSLMPFAHFGLLMIPVGYYLTYFKGGAPARSQSTSVFAADNLKKFVPNVKFTSQTTLGELWDGLYVKYRYRLAYPIALWVGFLYYHLWNPYMPASEKRKIREHQDRLSALEFHQP
ncbi:hypothetical protein HK101_010682 [Irineochytrium annulatum]|nr:hypothetical protein HK101_010682 [Irineochytrium annulatum]